MQISSEGDKTMPQGKDNDLIIQPVILRKWSNVVVYDIFNYIRVTSLEQLSLSEFSGE